MLIAIILLCVAVMVLGVASGKPYGWLALALAVAALLAAVLRHNDPRADLQQDELRPALSAQAKSG